ncbi:MAG: hypothetical protein ABIQ99_17700 [Thermoflexales bacterium]
MRIQAHPTLIVRARRLSIAYKPGMPLNQGWPPDAPANPFFQASILMQAEGGEPEEPDLDEPRRRHPKAFS